MTRFPPGRIYPWPESGSLPGRGGSRAAVLSAPGPGSEAAEAPVPDRAGLSIALRRGVPVARLAGSFGSESPAVESLARALSDLIACGNDRLLLDFGNVTRVSRRLLAVLARTHRALTRGGGRLRICNLHPELTRFVEASRAGRVLVIAADKEAGLTGAWSGGTSS